MKDHDVANCAVCETLTPLDELDEDGWCDSCAADEFATRYDGASHGATLYDEYGQQIGWDIW